MGLLHAVKDLASRKADTRPLLQTLHIQPLQNSHTAPFYPPVLPQAKATIAKIGTTFVPQLDEYANAHGCQQLASNRHGH